MNKTPQRQGELLTRRDQMSESARKLLKTAPSLRGMTFFVNSPVANLYIHPYEECEVISQVLYGWELRALHEHVYFRKIQTADGCEGWVSRKDLYVKKDPLMPSDPSPIIKIVHNAAHVYAQPDVIKQKPLMTLPFEVFLEVIAEPDAENFRWIRVRLVDGRSAWIQRPNTILNPSVLNRSQMLDLSRQFLGLPYTWGGISSLGYDCSGFIQMLFRQMGVCLPRNAYQQSASSLCRPISISELEKGDLVFFGASADKISHVGLYLGDSHIIHATTKLVPIVQITALDHASLKQRFTYRTLRRVKTPLN